jgi:hypothetical protein
MPPEAPWASAAIRALAAGGSGCNTRGAMRVLGALLLPVAVLLPAAYVGHRLSEDRPAPVPPTGVVWAGRVFVDSASLDRWLRARGGSYDVWAARHPQLAWPTAAKATSKAQATRPGTGHLMLGGLLALAAGVVLALTVANPPRGLIRLASRRGPPELVWRGSVARSQAVVAAPVRETPATRVLTTARAVPGNASYALHRLKRNHPQLGWYAAGGLLAAAVGVLVPYSLH